jgi:hypothetical protein
MRVFIMKGLIIITQSHLNPVIPRLDRGIQKGTGCPLKTHGHDLKKEMEL